MAQLDLAIWSRPPPDLRSSFDPQSQLPSMIPSGAPSGGRPQSLPGGSSSWSLLDSPPKREANSSYKSNSRALAASPSHGSRSNSFDWPACPQEQLQRSQSRSSRNATPVAFESAWLQTSGLDQDIDQEEEPGMEQVEAENGLQEGGANPAQLRYSGGIAEPPVVTPPAVTCENAGWPPSSRMDLGSAGRRSPASLSAPQPATCPKQKLHKSQSMQQLARSPSPAFARKLGVGLTVLKKKSRVIGIPRWPHRKLKSLESLILYVQELAKGSEGQVSAPVLSTVEELEKLRNSMATCPALALTDRTKRLRQASFRISYERRQQATTQDPSTSSSQPPPGRGEERIGDRGTCNGGREGASGSGVDEGPARQRTLAGGATDGT
eukprot:jgi/Mesen1/10981/ME000096S10561